MKTSVTTLTFCALALVALGFAANGWRVYRTQEAAKTIPLGMDSAQVVHLLGAPGSIEPRPQGVAYPTYARMHYSVPLFLPNACTIELNEQGKVHGVHTQVALAD